MGPDALSSVGLRVPTIWHVSGGVLYGVSRRSCLYWVVCPDDTVCVGWCAPTGVVLSGGVPRQTHLCRLVCPEFPTLVGRRAPTTMHMSAVEPRCRCCCCCCCRCCYFLVFVAAALFRCSASCVSFRGTYEFYCICKISYLVISFFVDWVFSSWFHVDWFDLGGSMHFDASTCNKTTWCCIFKVFMISIVVFVAGWFLVCCFRIASVKLILMLPCRFNSCICLLCMHCAYLFLILNFAARVWHCEFLIWRFVVDSPCFNVACSARTSEPTCNIRRPLLRELSSWASATCTSCTPCTEVKFYAASTFNEVATRRGTVVGNTTLQAFTTTWRHDRSAQKLITKYEILHMQ